MEKLTVYHGSFSKIAHFWAFTHFGSKEVALQALSNKLRYGSNQEPTQLLYKVELMIPEGSKLILDDWGFPSSRMLARYLSEREDFCDHDRRTFKNIEESIEALFLKSKDPKKPKGRRADFDEYGYQELAKKFLSDQIKVIEYENTYESSLAEISYCVIDTSIIKILSQEEI